MYGPDRTFKGQSKRYWLKQPELLGALAQLEKVVDKMRWTRL